MPFKKVFEGVCEGFTPGKFDREDGGQALIATIAGEYVPDVDEPGMFVRIQSWDESGVHKEALKIEGKRIRVTIEELPPEESQ